MELFIQSAALVLIAVILALLLQGNNRVFAAGLSMSVCAMVLIGLGQYLQPVVELLEQLQDLSGMSGQTLGILLKAAGISLTAQLAELICSDTGQSALGKAISLLGNAAILWISIPLIQALLELLQEVLGG